MKRRFFIFWMILCVMLGGCSAAPAPEAPAAPDAVVPTYAIIVKDTTNPYMARMYEGFEDACTELGANAHMVGPGKDGSLDQADLIRALVAQGVDAIAIAANDSQSVSAALQEAIAAGIKVVSLDSMVAPDDRMVHIQQASPEMIGRVLIQAGAQMIGSEGEIAILSTTPTTPNQSSWVRWMEYELNHQADKYPKISLVDIAYGLDESEASSAEARRLIEQYPNLKLIIAPTIMGISAAAKTVSELGSPVKVTGLGLPSAMEPYINSGVCPWMYLWNPSEVGYLAAYAAHALVEGQLTGQIDEIMSAGSLGDKVVTKSEDGGSEIVLGNPKMFDSSNITMWKEVF